MNKPNLVTRLDANQTQSLSPGAISFLSCNNIYDIPVGSDRFVCFADIYRLNDRQVSLALQPQSMMVDADLHHQVMVRRDSDVGFRVFAPDEPYSSGVPGQVVPAVFTEPFTNIDWELS